MERRAYLATMASIAGISTWTQSATADDDPPSDLLGTFDDFESLEPWRAYQDIGSITATTEYAATGTQSALLEPREDDGQVRVRRELEEPIDVRGVAPGVAMAADRSARVRLQLQDYDGHYVEFSRQCRAGMPFVRDNFGLSRISGEPDLSAVETLQLVSWFGDDGEGQLLVDDWYFVPTPETGTVLVQFHGGYERHSTEALEIIANADTDLPATAFVPTDRIGERDRLALEDLETLSAAGWTIGSYGARGTPLDGTGEVMEANVTSPISWLAERGFDGPRVLAVPGSRYSTDSYELTQEHYDLAFAGWGLAQGYPADPHRFSVITDPSAEEATELLEWTAASGGITTVAFTTFDDEEDLEALETLVSGIDDLVSAGALEVGTPEQVLEGISDLDLEESADAEPTDTVIDDSDGDAVTEETDDVVETDDEVIGSTDATEPELNRSTDAEPSGDNLADPGWDEIGPRGRTDADSE